MVIIGRGRTVTASARPTLLAIRLEYAGSVHLSYGGGILAG